jgi:hypothetical protein
VGQPLRRGFRRPLRAAGGDQRHPRPPVLLMTGRE